MNRFLLGLLGLVLVLAGAFALAVHFGYVPQVDRSAALLPGTALPPTWVLWVIAAAAVVIALLCLRWLTAQIPRRKVAAWRWADEAGATRITTATAAAPFAEEITAYPGVRKVEAALTGPHTAPRLALVVRAHGDADLRGIRRRIDDEGLPRLREALGTPDLHATVEFRMSPTKADARVH
ncbi:alkaline shock response membrane anchor protein AmaP [Lentzea sp. NBC_00516]|uniref:alkaline shock response membrane anchor protein AmaP n=1 Tax=Lentzea sp. NBC_00516 TaxID=2903582 RepID=UPI002E81E381|nr:alkaline shock response membrane anchor protein AmaP [Lentzea sp. NBC_00516]WUD20975.1 alkaline shock response membrane anchor protein AmaP [Lentzea sp. NBC_00516]